MHEGSAALINAQSMLLYAWLCGMLAENARRLSCGVSIVFGYDEFCAVYGEYDRVLGYMAIMGMRDDTA